MRRTRRTICSTTCGPGTLQLPALPPLSLYVHLPWCLKKCPYCDFNSHEMAAGRAAGAALPRRAGRRPGSRAAAGVGPHGAQHLHRRRHAQPVLAGRPSTGCCRRHARAAEAGAGLRDHAGGQPRHLRERPLPRLPRAPASRACRSACRASTTRTCRRWAACTTARQAIAAVEEAAHAFDTFNLDLMYALPGQTLAQLEAGRDAGAGADAAAPVDLPPDHRAQHLLRQVPAA